ncbi:RNA-directed DNA polymerase [Sagittula sp.]|uniref:RNA-directed DNA polymerase n=1 Tax=Sagittula sp. TaxID=2038081 RepID=UPI00351855E1
MNQEESKRIDLACTLAAERIALKGSDDVFRPPIFAQSMESLVIQQNPQRFQGQAKEKAVKFLKVADLTKIRIGQARRGLVLKDASSFRLCAWIDPFDAVNYLSAAYLLFPQIEAARIAKERGIVHSHRMSSDQNGIFDQEYGYKSFRAKSAEISEQKVGKWKVVTDIANFFDRIGNHSLENHLTDIGCDKRYVKLIREMLYFWAGDRRSFGIPVGSDASRILSEAALIDVDAKLHKNGVNYIRYVDGFRIFADSRAEALKHLEILTRLLADEGLSLNSRKTDVFKILSPEEIASIANRFADGEHEVIDIDEKIEVRERVRISGRSTISRFYKEPGKEALRSLQQLEKETIIQDFEESSDNEVEQHIKLLMKFFVYVDQDVEILSRLIQRRITSIYYIADALTKEFSRFSDEKREEIKATLFSAEDWLKCASPIQVPILRISGTQGFSEPNFIQTIVDEHRQIDSMLFFREAITLGASCLDRSRLRHLARDVFPDVPTFVQRSIYQIIFQHKDLSDDEKRPLLKNMKQHSNDWFIENFA